MSKLEDKLLNVGYSNWVYKYMHRDQTSVTICWCTCSSDGKDPKDDFGCGRTRFWQQVKI